MQLMVAATLVLLCTRPLEVGLFAQAPWLLPIPSIAIIGREVMNTYLISNARFTHKLFFTSLGSQEPCAGPSSCITKCILIVLYYYFSLSLPFFVFCSLIFCL